MKKAHGDTNPTSVLAWFSNKQRSKDLQAARTRRGDKTTCSSARCSTPQGKETSSIQVTDKAKEKTILSGKISAAILIITHILEFTLMLTITLTRVISKAQTKGDVNQHPENSFTSFGSAQLTYFLTLFIYLFFLLVPLLILTTISFIWTLKSQDFDGKSAARIVCWVLHFCQASLIWRYLKIQLVYDPSDVAELGTLRFVQVHLHTLPFLVLHTAFSLAEPKLYLFSFSLGLTLLLSAVITIVIATTVRKLPNQTFLSLPTISQLCDLTTNNEVDPNQSDITARIIVGITTCCALYCRVLSLSILFCLHITLAAFLVLVHWIISFAWVCIQEDMRVVAVNHNKKWLRRTFLSYLLIWDWHVFRDDSSALNICARPRLPAMFYTVVSSENLCIVIVWFVISCYKSPVFICLALLTSVTLLQFIALGLLVLSYLYYASIFPNWIYKPSSIPQLNETPLNIDKKIHNSSSEEPNMLSYSNETNNQISSSYIDFKEFENSEELSDKKVKDVENSDEVHAKRISSVNQGSQKHPTSLTPHLLFRGLHPSMFSFSSDLLPPVSKSERSSMENGSFNSRNTNTIAQISAITSECDNVNRPHSSFSDSFSSLSCGTTQRNIYSSLKFHNRMTCTPAYGRARIRRHTSCHNGSCHCKIFDVVGHTCQNRIKTRVIRHEDKITDNRPENTVKLSSLKVSVITGSQKPQIFCTPSQNSNDAVLLSKCLPNCQYPQNIIRPCEGFKGGGSSTGYPSDTEVTATLDTLSTISAESHSTYTTWPVGKGPGLAKLLTREKGHDYVTAWLRHQQSRSNPPAMSNVNYKIRGRRHPTKQKFRANQNIVQNLETIV